MNKLQPACGVVAVLVLTLLASSVRADLPGTDMVTRLRELAGQAGFAGSGDDTKLTFGELLSFLSDKYELAFEIDESAFRQDMVEEDLMNAPISETTPFPKMKD